MISRHSISRYLKLGVLLPSCLVLALTVASTPAGAVTTCNTGHNGQFSYYWALCSGQPGTEFRVYILCQNIYTLSSHYQYGPWETLGGGIPSVTDCQWGVERKLGDWVNYQIQ